LDVGEDWKLHSFIVSYWSSASTVADVKNHRKFPSHRQSTIRRQWWILRHPPILRRTSICRQFSIFRQPTCSSKWLPVLGLTTNWRLTMTWEFTMILDIGDSGGR